MKNLLLIFTLISFTSFLNAQDVFIPDVRVVNEFNTAAVSDRINIEVEIDYETTLPSGVRIYVEPYYNGAALATTFESSPVVSTGSGTHTAHFRLDDPLPADMRIDEIRVLVESTSFNPLTEFFVPCDIRVGAVNVWATDDMFSRTHQMFLNNSSAYVGYHLNIYGLEFIGYEIEVLGYAGDELVTFTEAPMETFFSITDSAALVNNVGVPMTRIDKWVLRYRQTYPSTGEYVELEYPVDWLWADVVVDSDPFTSILWPLNGDSTEIEFEHMANLGRSAEVFMIPESSGDDVLSGAAIPSQLVNSTGASSFQYTVPAGDVDIDAHRFEFRDPSTSELLYDFSFPTIISYGDIAFYRAEYSIPSPARIRPGVHYVHMKFLTSNDHPFPVRVQPIPVLENFVLNGGADVSGDAFNQPGTALFRAEQDREHQTQLMVDINRISNDSLTAQYALPVDWLWADDYVNPCGTENASIPAPVDLTKSFRPVPFPHGDVDRVQVKWFKSSPELPYPSQDEVGCDIQFWPIRDLELNTPIIGADSVIISDVTKLGRDLFKWPIKFRKNGANNNKRVVPSTRYNWRVRCACNKGTGNESPWSEIKIFNTPAFDPATGIYTPPVGHYIGEDGEVKRTGEELLEIRAFPNPVQNELTIQSTQGIGLERIELLDMTGRLVKQELGFGEKQYEYRIDLSGLPAGMFMTRVSAKGMQEVIRIEKR